MRQCIEKKDLEEYLNDFHYESRTPGYIFSNWLNPGTPDPSVNTHPSYAHDPELTEEENIEQRHQACLKQPLDEKK